MNQNNEGAKRNWTRDEVQAALKEILVDALSVEEAKITPDASLIHDLGAESIDFLDIGFRVQQTFGVELPNRAIQERTLSWRNLEGLRRIVEKRYGMRLAPEELRQLHTKGVPEVLRWLGEKDGIQVKSGDAEIIAGELADRLVQEVEAIGFKGSLIDRQATIGLLMENLNSPKIMETMLRLFRVEALVDFIADRVSGDAQ